MNKQWMGKKKEERTKEKKIQRNIKRKGKSIDENMSDKKEIRVRKEEDIRKRIIEEGKKAIKVDKRRLQKKRGGIGKVRGIRETAEKET